MQTKWKLTRRDLLGSATAATAAATTPWWLAGRAARAQKTTELVHWSWLAASDGEVWAQMIESFNDAHKDKGVQIRMEVIPEEQYTTKVLASAVTGQAPDFGWGTAGLRAKMAKDGVDRPARRPRQAGRARPRRLRAPFALGRRATRNTTTSSAWCRWT